MMGRRQGAGGSKHFRGRPLTPLSSSRGVKRWVLVGLYSLPSIFSKVKLAQFFLEFDFYHIFNSHS